MEIDAPKALERWLAPRRATFEAIALRGTWLDADDVGRLLRLSLPGIDEVAALMEIGRLGEAGRHDLLVVDTAPTGHTLRMLATPELLRTVAAVFDRMQGKHRAIVEALRGRWTPDESDALVAALDDEGRRLSELLRDGERAVMTWVTLPEQMAVAETIDALAELRRLDVRVDTLVVNRVTPAPDRRCQWCSVRRGFERGAIEGLLASIGGSMRVAAVAARPTEPRGPAALRAIAAEMQVPARFPRGAAKPATRRAPRLARGPGAPVTIGGPKLSLLMFGGKGGVGKTTCAAAFAIAIAKTSPSRRVLLLSADPAHSLGDALGVPLGDEPRRVRGAPANLTARELDPAARFESLRQRYTRALDALFGRLVRGTAVDATGDRQSMRDLLDLAPPGLDELIAIVEVSDALETGPSGAPPVVVLDTAPSGHALRLLEMPSLVHDWVKALMSMLLKYQPIAGIGELGAVLLQTSQGLGRLRALLADPARCAFVAVTRPAALPMAESTRLHKRLAALDISVPLVIVNAVGAGSCGACATTRANQERALASMRRTLRGRPLIIAPASVPPPHGARGLSEWRRTWMAG
jgi:arsenite-transporting ATPase